MSRVARLNEENKRLALLFENVQVYDVIVLTTAFPDILLQRSTRMASDMEHIVAGLMTGEKSDRFQV